jgi:hypothetical protein
MKKLIKFTYNRIYKHPKTSGILNILSAFLDTIITLALILIIIK